MTGNNKQRYRFSEAPIWNIQRQYYEEEGTKAWNNDQVPQYITSNPMIAAAYAEMIFGFLQDRANREYRSEPVFIVELGAGAGRLAYHVLHELCQLRDYAGISLPGVPLYYDGFGDEQCYGLEGASRSTIFYCRGITGFCAI